MIKRTLYFGNPVWLHVRRKQLVVEQKNNSGSNVQQASVPVEDIGLVVIDHPQVCVSHALTNALLEINAAILWCNDKHMPNGLVLPMSVNHVYTEKLRHQLAASKPLRKQLWRQTIQAKIRNQAGVLSTIGHDVSPLQRWGRNVASGDPENLEARAARWYWERLFQNDAGFLRQRYGAPPNAMLNYGYAVLRSIVARSLVGSGMLPAVGIHHRNKYNPFCLADDIMEPYRPYIDHLIYEFFQSDDSNILSDELSPEVKKSLLSIPVLDVRIGEMTSPLMIATQRTTSSLMQCFEHRSRKILYPEFSRI